MDEVQTIAAVAAIAAALALLIGWLAWGRPFHGLKAEAEALKTDLAGRMRELAERGAEVARLSADLSASREQVAALHPEAQRAQELAAEVAGFRAAAEERDKAHARQLAELETRFTSLAASALDAAQRRFAEQAAETLKTHRLEAEKGVAAGRDAIAELIRPIRETMGKFETSLGELESKREQAYGSLSQQLQALVQAESAMRAEAGRIVAALKGSAKATGAWGEAQLRRVLEVGGLSEGIDFTVQASTTDADGQRSRPDAIINLPGGRQLIVDAKCALDDHVAAMEATSDRDRADARKRHALRLRAHAKSLAEKAYWDQFSDAPDFVLMFVPGENFLSAALEEDPELHLWAMGRRVLLVGPTNLLAIARVVAMVWRQEKMADEARAIGDLGAELYERLRVMAGHMNRVGKNIDDTARAWNDFVGSVEGRVLVTGRKLGELGADRKAQGLPEARRAESTVRLIQAADARETPDRPVAADPSRESRAIP
ncbi:DNA recombination protein RmuC [Thermaurantiacus sp.]